MQSMLDTEYHGLNGTKVVTITSRVVRKAADTAIKPSKVEVVHKGLNGVKVSSDKPVYVAWIAGFANYYGVVNRTRETVTFIPKLPPFNFITF
jgi:hypothetical protein